MTRTFAIMLCLSGFALTAHAQDVSAASPEMERIGFLLGNWLGRGWIMTDGSHRTFIQTEHVSRRAGGAVVVLDGSAKSTDSSDYGQIVHRAFGVVSFDTAVGVFRWYAVRGGQQVDTEAKIGDRQLIWSTPGPNGSSIRYTIRIDERGRWFEIGEYSSDGQIWTQVFETTLERVP
jgi:hypothetical protein